MTWHCKYFSSMFSLNIGHDQHEIWGFFFKKIKYSKRRLYWLKSEFYFIFLKKVAKLHKPPSGGCCKGHVELRVHAWGICVSCGFTEGGEAKWDAAALRHLTSRKWKGGEWRGGSNMEQLPALQRPGAPVMKPGILYFTGETPSQPNSSRHFPPGCVCSAESLMGGG